MSTFLYWVPTPKPIIQREAITQYGLDYALPYAAISRPAFNGPGGQGAGAVVVDSVASALLPSHGYHPDRQEWRQLEQSEVWVGWFPEAMPSPDGLARTAMTPLKRPVTLSDGRQWLAPVAQRIVENESVPTGLCSLPQSVARKDGEWVLGEVRQQYRELWRVARETFDRMQDGNGSIAIQLDSAVIALAANYRIGPTEAGILGLFESDGAVAWEVLKVLIDYAGLDELLSGKSRAAG